MLGEGLRRSLVEEVDAPGNDYLGQTVLPRDRQALRARRRVALQQCVCDLGERVVDHAREGTACNKLLHRRAADAVGVKDDGFVPCALESSS